MNAYVYRAALYCPDCAPRRTPDCDDSEHCPQGPYPDGAGEADSPQHCDSCNVFLENPLTSDGVEYVREQIRIPTATTSGAALMVAWRAFYADVLAA